MIPKTKEFEGLNITFNTGESCNLACKYCYEVDKRVTVLPLDYAKRFIDLILTDPDPIGVVGTDNEWILQRGLVLDFIGGDSLMFPELLTDILEYFKYRVYSLDHRWKYNWRASISTNGTLFENEAVRRFIERYRDVLHISVSVDGCPEIHDLNRIFPDGRGSMSSILKYWDWYKELYGDSATTKSTLNRESIPYLFESLKYMHETLKLSQINQNFIFEDMQLTSKDLSILDQQLELCVDYVLKHSSDLYWSMLDRTVAESISFSENCKLKPNSGWCGSGSMPALSPNGKIYSCFRFLPHTIKASLEEDLSVGDVWQGFTKKANFCKVREASRETISPEKCKHCDIESGCSWCIAGGVSETGTFVRQTYICETQKLRDKWAKVYWKRFDERK